VILRRTLATFFSDALQAVIWGLTAQCIGASNLPSNVSQYWVWIKTWLPGGGMFHSFGLAAICWVVWKTRNSACFENKRIKHPADILCQACAYINFWTGLYKPEFQEQLAAGINVILTAAYKVLASQRRTKSRLLQIEEAGVEDKDEDEDPDA
jgi:hypothetical protein